MFIKIELTYWVNLGSQIQKPELSDEQFMEETTTSVYDCNPLTF